ncbi:M48 family metalloprotease [Psychrobacter sp. N25K4-3-2]|uniref:M48 family metalloprotease n=1 Tax=Psychrobacter sp. N25K4-3-2 TaxID=2785026 RepID=UPI00188B36B5|nr:M48 family metalloprotease [Psychrobacter sp. N25K4-3-2]MBF4488446.1 M48 family metalloprotease [Psychrobacter sp. N25K4-3-2]
MDFFGEQRIRTRRSLFLYGLFLLIVLAHMAVGLAVMGLLLTVFTGGISHWILVLVIILILGSFIGGSFLEYRRLRAGGRAIAQRVGAVRLFIDNSQEAWEHSHGVAHQHETKEKVRYSSRHIAVRDERDFPPVYRRYCEIAQQLAIASGLSTPILYVLPDEQGINGFVAGRHSQDMVLVVTQGALDKLSDEALYGLIGHEYGHILHGDATFNLQLMVILAGLQILYDWSDPISNHRSFETDITSHQSLSQRQVDNFARSTEAQTASFTTHSEWVVYWQQQPQQKQLSAKRQSKWVQNRPVIDRQAPRSVWTLLLHGLSFSSMASAQLIKHSFNRQRELLADATSVQLTRSPAIVETLKAIYQDSLGSRLSGIADINGLSHFFFASSGADLGDVSWFATHPSLTERMGAINADAYHQFSVQVAKDKQINQQKIKEIYEQRRLGDVGKVKENSLSINKKENANKQSLYAEPLSTQALDSRVEKEEEKGLDFVVAEDLVIDGRLQVKPQDTGTHQLLKPWQAKPDSDLPSAVLISIDDIEKVSLPQYILDHSHHPLGAQALIEAVMLCHQGQALATTSTYDLVDIWYEISTNKADNNCQSQILPHAIDHKLIETVASVDRRLDSVLITTAIKNLSQHDLSESVIAELRLKHESSHSNQSYQHYVQQKKCRTMLLRYQQGIFELFQGCLTADLSQNFADNIVNDDGSADTAKSGFTHSENAVSQVPSILSLWQALHLQKLLPILSKVLNDKSTDRQIAWQQTLQAGTDSIVAQLDPSGQVFDGLRASDTTMLTLLAYRLSKDVKGQMISKLDSSLFGYNNDSVSHYIVDLRRHARLVDITLTEVSDANLQWLLLTAQGLNSVQLLAIIDAVPSFHKPTSRVSITDTQIEDNYREKQQDSSQIDYNEYRQWLSTLHTVMLHDTIVSQDEHDCLMLLAEHWLGVRQLF